MVLIRLPLWSLVVVLATRSVQASFANKCVCQVVETATYAEHADGTRSSASRFDCLATSSTDGARRLYLDVTKDSEYFIANEEAFREGEWFIEYPCDEVADAGGVLSPGKHMLYTLSKAEIKYFYDSSESRRLEEGDKPFTQTHHYHNHRRLSNVGKQGGGLVIVHAEDTVNPLTREEGDEILYHKAGTQMGLCSNGAVELYPKVETIELILPGNLADYNSETVSDFLFQEVCKNNGFSADCEITKELGLDHILFALPFGLQGDVPGEFWAIASTGDDRRFSAYSGGAFIPATIMHELGHNYRLGHALDPIEDGDDLYGDLTGMMGGGTETRKCFNGYNYFVLGWHSEQTNEIPLVSGEAARYNLAGIGHVSEGNVVNIKAGEYFITFNLKTFFNSGIDRAGYDEDYPNEVLIHQGQDIKFGQSIHSAYHDTSLVGSLAEVNNRYMVEVVDIGNVVGDLIIQICSLDPMGSGSVELSIGVDAVDCDTMGNVNTPQGIQILTSGVPLMGLSAALDEIIEFKMDLPYEPEKVICTSFGGSGDVDLIMNFDSSPQVLYSSTINTCFSRTSGNHEVCESPTNGARSVFVTLDAFEVFSGVTVFCTAVGGSDEWPEEENTTGTPYNLDYPMIPMNTPTLISANEGETLNYAMVVPELANDVTCYIYYVGGSGGEDDADLYMNFDEEIDLVNREANFCAPWEMGGIPEACVTDELGDVLYLSVNAYESFANVVLFCQMSVAPPPPENTVGPVELFSNLQKKITAPIDGLVELFIKIPPGTTSAYCAMGSGSGDADMYARWNYKADAKNLYANDCVPFKHGNNEICTAADLGPPAGDILHITLFAYRAFTDVSVLCLLS